MWCSHEHNTGQDRIAAIWPQRVHYFWHYAGNEFLTLLSDMLTNT